MQRNVCGENRGVGPHLFTRLCLHDSTPPWTKTRQQVRLFQARRIDRIPVGVGREPSRSRTVVRFGRGRPRSIRSRRLPFPTHDVYVRVKSKVVDGWPCDARSMPTTATDDGVAWLPRTIWTSSREKRKRWEWTTRRIRRCTGACACMAMMVRRQPFRQRRARRNKSVSRDEMRRPQARVHAEKESKNAGKPPAVVYELTNCSFLFKRDDAPGLVPRWYGQRPHLMGTAVCFCKFGRW